MRARTLILVFLAIILAGGTAFLARNFLARERETIVQEQAPLKVQAPAKSVLVAKVDLKRGQILFINNRWLFHNRSGFEDHPEPERRRHLVRLWLKRSSA